MKDILESTSESTPEITPGRSCPLRYRYGASAIAHAPQVEAETLYVVGGLYGNVEALEVIERMAAAESGDVRVCFNGDFNWFNVDDEGFEQIMSRVLQHDAVLGNVEAELGIDGAEAGCGCAYPESVSAEVVERSNRIHARLKATASRHASLTARLTELPMFARYLVGHCRVGVVHGDAESLAGWRFSRDELDNPASAAWLNQVFEEAAVDVFASSHTCEPVLKHVQRHNAALHSNHTKKLDLTPLSEKLSVVINNGAAGMPNDTAALCGRITRISRTPFQTQAVSAAAVIERTFVGEIEVAALSVPYDHEKWRARFLANWPEGSDAYQSYYARITGESV